MSGVRTRRSRTAPLALFAALVMLAFASPAPAAEPAGGYVRDDAGVLTTRTIRDVADLNAQWESEGKTTRLKVVTMDPPDGSVEDAARRLFVSDELDGDDILFVYAHPTGFRHAGAVLAGDDLKAAIPDDLGNRLLVAPDDDADVTDDDAVRGTVGNIRDALAAGGVRPWLEQRKAEGNAGLAGLLYVPLLAYVWLGSAFIEFVRREFRRKWEGYDRSKEDPPFDSVGRLSERRKRRMAAAGYTDAEIGWIESARMELMGWVVILTVPAAAGPIIIPFALWGGVAPRTVLVCALLVAVPVLFWNIRARLLRWPLPEGRPPRRSE